LAGCWPRRRKPLPRIAISAEPAAVSLLELLPGAPTCSSRSEGISAARGCSVIELESVERNAGWPPGGPDDDGTLSADEDLGFRCCGDTLKLVDVQACRDVGRCGDKLKLLGAVLGDAELRCWSVGTAFIKAFILRMLMLDRSHGGGRGEASEQVEELLDEQ